MAQTVTGRRPAIVVGLALSLLAQLVMIVVGLWLVVFAEDDETTLLLLALWCAIGTVYLIVVLVVLGRLSKATAPGARPARWETGRAARLISMTATILASLIGLGAAVQVLALHNDPQVGSETDFVGVWSMLLAWGFLHWGFAQIYFQRYYSSPEPMLRFPQRDREAAPADPRFVDFVYFAYTLGTTFAASDVEVLSTRMRWTIVWHSVVSYFFNGLIIVLALNTIMSGAK